DLRTIELTLVSRDSLPKISADDDGTLARGRIEAINSRLDDAVTALRLLKAGRFSADIRVRPSPHWVLHTGWTIESSSQRPRDPSAHGYQLDAGDYPRLRDLVQALSSGALRSGR